MAANTVVRARIDEKVKNEASIVLAEMGLTVSDAFRMLLTKIAREKRYSVEPLMPNALTQEAISELEHGEGKSFNTVDDLMTSLDAD